MDKSGFIRIRAVEPELGLFLTSCSLTMTRLQRPVFTDHMAAIQRRQRASPQSKDATYSKERLTAYLANSKIPGNRIPDFFLPHRLFKLAGDVYAYIFIHIHTDAHVHISVCVCGGAGECMFGILIGLQTF